MRGHINFINFLFILLISFVISSCQTNDESIGTQDKELERVMRLLIRSTDFNQGEYLWEKESYSFERRFNISGIERASANISGKHLETNFDFLLIHEISFSTSTTKNLIDPSWDQISIQVLDENHEAYCFSSEMDYLSSCIVIIQNNFLLSKIEVRLFQNFEPTAIEIVSLGTKLFIERLNNSEFK